MKADMFDLTGKTAVITGGARGLGLAMAHALAEFGAKTALIDLDGALAQEEAVSIGDKFAVEAMGMEADVRSLESMDAVVERTTAALGSVDVWVNNAGISCHGPSLELTMDDWQRVIDTNLTGGFIGSKAAAGYMKGNGGGVIINVASMSGKIVNIPQSQAAYNAAKAGVIHLTKSLAGEWAALNIRVNSISPGYMETPMTRDNLQSQMGQEYWLPMTPMKRAGHPSELHGAVVFLASPASSFVTGADLVIDGGYTIW